ncbi:hypothetical protein [Synechococcus elongatus]|uniref:hypothetical protein n=1 Tax=Synechococcus elongatus TaxID=32046 RepID=UPI0030CD096E
MSSQPTASLESLQQAERRWQRRLSLGLLALAAGSLALLLVQPRNEPCGRFWVWWLAPVAERLYCAGQEAQQGQLASLQQALFLAQTIPASDPLYDTAQRYIEQWTWQAIELAKVRLDDGDLAGAIAILQQLPKVPCRDRDCAQTAVTERLEQWPRLWEEAEQLVAEAEAELLQLQWDRAAALASGLLANESAYWNTRRYEALNRRIAAVRSPQGPFPKVAQQLSKGDLEGLLAAIQLLRTVPETSPVRDVAEANLERTGDRLLDLATAALDRRQLDLVEQITAALQTIPSLRETAQDLQQLQAWQVRTWSGEIPELAKVVAAAETYPRDRPLAPLIQQYSSRWQAEIEDLRRLAQAERLAASGRIEDLRQALGVVRLIAETNPRSAQVQRLQQSWQARIEQSEDQPTLQAADRLAAEGKLLEAIATAQRIFPGRALYTAAQARVQDWQLQIDAQGDRELLAQAQAFAAAQDWDSAIRLAQQIPPGRPLYGVAQAQIRTWEQARPPLILPDDPTAPSRWETPTDPAIPTGR